MAIMELCLLQLPPTASVGVCAGGVIRQFRCQKSFLAPQSCRRDRKAVNPGNQVVDGRGFGMEGLIAGCAVTENSRTVRGLHCTNGVDRIARLPMGEVQVMYQ